MLRNEAGIIAIVDLGAARTKVTIATRDSAGLASLRSSSINVSLAALSAQGAPAAEEAISLIKAQALGIAREANATSVTFVGAQAFRSEGAGSLLEAAERALPNFKVLTPELEGAVFFSSVALEERVADFLAVDVGGGSVQIVWGDGEGQSASAPVGTFALEKAFQEGTAVSVLPASESWRRMMGAVGAAFHLPAEATEGRKRLFFGSSIMKDFFSSALLNANLSSTAGGELSLDQARALALLVGGKPYAESYYLFPQNTGFLHGADKLLAVVIRVMELVGSSSAAGTNASVSGGLSRMLLDSSHWLAERGISSTPLN